MMPNPWLLVGAAALVICSFFYGRHTGVQVTKADWEAEKAALAVEAANTLAKAQAEVAEVERLLAAKQNKVERVYVDRIKTVEDDSQRLSDISKSDGLFISASCPDNSNTMPSAASSASGDNAGTKARLSGEAAEALIAIAADADRIVHQLTACQKILEAERQ